MTELQRLVVATDGSEPAASAARFAGDLASRFDGSVKTVAVVPKPSAAAAAWVGANLYLPIETGSDRAVANARHTSEAAVMLAEERGCPKAEATVEIGDPAQAIVDVANGFDADAIVMGRRGTGNVSGLFLGSVSTKVSHLSDRTVITVRTERASEIDRILVAVDGSGHASRAARLACVLAGRFNADLDVLHVVGISKLAPFGYSAGEGFDYDRLADNLRIYGEQIVDEAAQPAVDAGVSVSTAIAAGDPATRIIQHADRTGADVICIGRRGLGKVSGILLGSVSHSVAHGATQTVATVV